MIASSSPRSEAVATIWEDNTSACAVCGVALGKRHLMPRHHCRLCGRCVCAPCSPNFVQLGGHREPQRVCFRCVEGVESAPALRNTIFQFLERLRIFVGPHADAATNPNTIEEALAACDTALQTLEARNSDAHPASLVIGQKQGVVAPEETGLVKSSKCDKIAAEAAMQELKLQNQLLKAEYEAMKDRFEIEAAQERESRQQLESKADTAWAACLRLRDRIRNLSKIPCSEQACMTLEEAVLMCGAALAPLEAAQRRQIGSGSPRGDVETAEDCALTPVSLASLCSARGGMGQQLLQGRRASEAPETFTIHDGEHRWCNRHRQCSGLLDSERVGRRRCRKAAGFSICLLIVMLFVFAACRVLVLVMTRSGARAINFAVVSATVSDPGQDSLRLRSSVLLHHGFFASSRIGPFRMMVSSGGSDLGWLTVPEVWVTPGEPTLVGIDTQLIVVNATALRASAGRILDGVAEEWHATGSTSVSLIGCTGEVHLSTRVVLPSVPSKLRQVHGARLDIISGSEEQLRMTAEAVEFFSSSPLDLEGFGRATFVVHPVRDDGSVRDDVRLGTLVVPRFKMVQGLNALGDASFEFDKTLATEGHLEALVSDWLSGVDHVVALMLAFNLTGTGIGPIYKAFTLLGQQGSILRSALANKEHSILGHAATTGRRCFLTTGADCLRGSAIVAESVASRNVTLTDVSLDVDLNENLSYSIMLMGPMVGPIGFKFVRCDKGPRMARMYSSKGMWTHVDPSRWDDETVMLPRSSQGGRAMTSFFLPSKPQPGQSDGSRCFTGAFRDVASNDCCFSTVLPAAACFYAQKGMDAIPVTVSGNLTIVVDAFSITARVQTDIAIMPSDIVDADALARTPQDGPFHGQAREPSGGDFDRLLTLPCESFKFERDGRG